MLEIESRVLKNVSYLHARDPSIIAYNRHGLDQVRVCLADNMLEETNDGKKKESAQPELVQVFLRIKGGVSFENIYEIKEDHLVCKVPEGSHALRNTRDGDSVIKTYMFSKIFGPDTTQSDIFNSIVKGKVLDFINGKNCTLLTYGASGSGKTFTIVGTPEEPGLIPRALEYLFRTLPTLEDLPKIIPLPNGDVRYVNEEIYAEEKHKRTKILNASLAERSAHIKTYKQMQQRLSSEPVAFIDDDLSNIAISIWVSVAEIYNENIYDLLQQPPPKRGQQRQRLRLGNYKDHNYIKDLTVINVSSGIDAYQVLQYGLNNLNFAATSINSHSSRSHCIFSIKLIQSSLIEDGTTVSTFNFCDLAGSERLKKTHNVGDRLKESNNINTSLLVLGRCINHIRSAQHHKDNRRVPFRESKLTQLFQRALAGHEDISMIVNVNPSLEMFDESQHVLNFSAVAKELKIVEHPQKIIKSKKPNRFSDYIEKKVATPPRQIDEGIEEDSETMKDHEINRLKEVVTQLYNDLENLKSESESSEQRLREYIIGEYNEFIKDIERQNKEEKERAVSLAKKEYEEKIEALKKQYENRTNVVYCVDSDSDSENEGFKGTIEELQNVIKQKDVTIQILKQELFQIKSEHELAQSQLFAEKQQIKILEAEIEDLKVTLIDAKILYEECLRKQEELQAEKKILESERINLLDENDMLHEAITSKHYNSDDLDDENPVLERIENNFDEPTDRNCLELP